MRFRESGKAHRETRYYFFPWGASQPPPMEALRHMLLTAAAAGANEEERKILMGDVHTAHLRAECARELYVDLPHP